MKTHHVCYEGTLACSGSNPCAHCLDVVNHEVLALAMRRTTEVITQARGVHGVVKVSELDAANFWAVFFGHYGEAWKILHANMMNDPKVAERAYDLRGIPGFVETGRYVPPAIAAMPLVPAADFARDFGTAPAPAPVPVPVFDPTFDLPSAAPVVPLSALAAQVPVGFPGAPLPTAPDPNATTWATPFVLRDDKSDARDAQVMTVSAKDITSASPSLPIDDVKLVSAPADIRREITADDIAASATVLDASSSSAANGAATVHD